MHTVRYDELYNTVAQYMTNLSTQKRARIFGNLGLLSWIACTRFLFPLPRIFSGDVSPHSIADAILWSITISMMVLGILASISLKAKPRLRTTIMFAMATAIYVGLRFLLDRAVYAVFLSDVMVGTPLKTVKLLWAVNPLGAIDAIIFGVLVPFALFAVLVWFAGHTKDRFDDA